MKEEGQYKDITHRSSSIMLDKLRFPYGRLYGRENKEKSLFDMYSRLVSGVAGDNGYGNDDTVKKKDLMVVQG
eukprot:CAMPEP_0201896160 /NCGR_PEP_ID=MMETSP0902-20130614/44041_1 /ASSEMBLY_ACC=CAM_ASM_000551 /TAXON_ID=420261 /ORGANISM="Thalassiosira antarctica, Strain CCMP982" /LENGTH=72 /DNA_ID=CAMNT_0048428669 /DNA_START=47 /DNA_END=265 /DNA_ORIENTATION=+